VKIEIRKLEKRDNRADFSSGDIEIDRFFVKFAGQNQFKHKIGNTYIAVESHSQNILGYATVTSSSMNIKELKLSEFKKFPNYPLPIFRIARLGIDKRYQSQGIGGKLLRKMLYLAIELEELVGCVGILVDAKDDAIGFYKRYSFEIAPVVDGELPSRPMQTVMYLSIRTIHKILN